MPGFTPFRDIRLGVKNLLRHSLRSLLTVLGVVFGVGSVVAMLAVGEGASQQALQQIQRLGSRNILIASVKPVEYATASRARSFMSIYGLLYEDEARISDTFFAVERTVPAKILRKEGRMGGRALELRIVGTTPGWFDLVRRQLLAGRVLVQADMAARKNAVVLTDHGARRLMAVDGGIGKTLRIGSESFEVVGVVRSEAGDAGGMETPDRNVDAYIPLTAARERFGDVFVRRTAGSRERELVELHQIIVEVGDVESVESTAAGIEAMLQRFHRRMDYQVNVPLALLRQTEATKRTFSVVLGSIAGISLLVGGIGIMNIMLATVTERTREIGIRRAIGAKRRQIVAQFLIETVVLSTAGGLSGIVLGLFLPWLISRLAGILTVVNLFSLVLSLGISMAVGIVFGLYPAVQAARLDPIVALRQR